MAKQRFGANQKRDIVIRLLKGENIEDISRELKISAGELSTWQRMFLEAGMESLKSRKKDPFQKKLDEAEKTIGRLTMKLELYKKKEDFIAQKGGIS